MVANIGPIVDNATWLRLLNTCGIFVQFFTDMKAIITDLGFLSAEKTTLPIHL